MSLSAILRLIARRRRAHSAVALRRRRSKRLTTSLDSIGVDAGRRAAGVDAHSDLVTALEIDVLDVKRVDVAWEKAQERKAYVDAQVGTAAGYEEDAERWDWTGVSYGACGGGNDVRKRVMIMMMIAEIILDAL